MTAAFLLIPWAVSLLLAMGAGTWVKRREYVVAFAAVWCSIMFAALGCALLARAVWVGVGIV